MAWTTPKTWATGELVTATDLNTHLRDNLNALFTPNYVEVAINNFSTTSGSYVDVTGASVDITTKGGNLFVWVAGPPGNNTYLAISIDGGAETLLNYNVPAMSGLLRRFTGISAATHTVKLRLKASTGTATFYSDGYARLIVAEGIF